MSPSTDAPYVFGDVLVHPDIPGIVWIVVRMHPTDPTTAIAVRARDGGSGGWFGHAGDIGSLNVNPRAGWKVNP